MSKGKKLSSVLLPSIGILNVDINVGRAAFCGNVGVMVLRLVGGVTLGQNF
jgi:hypothetical protein